MVSRAKGVGNGTAGNCPYSQTESEVLVGHLFTIDVPGPSIATLVSHQLEQATDTYLQVKLEEVDSVRLPIST